MSTIGRARPPRRERADRDAAGPDVTRPDAARRVDAPTARTVRVRNVCLQHFAAHQHLPVPTDAELEVLPGDMTLAQSVEWWRAAHGRAEPATAERARPRSGLDLGRAAGIAAMVAFALAVTYGKAQ